jgi:drug/metabolite transporter (DMT)-like permease
MDYPVPYLGEAAALTASLVWSCSITLYRAQGQGIPAQTLNLFKLLVALTGYALIVSLLYVLGQTGLMATSFQPHFPANPEKIGWLMLSGVLGLTIGDTFFFASIGRLGAQLTAAIQCLTPPLNALIDWLYFGELLSLPQSVGLTLTILAVIGVICAGSPVTGLVPGSRGWWLGLVFALASSVFNAISYSMTGYLLQGENVFACSMVRIAPALLLLLLPALFSPLGRSGVRLMLTQPRRMEILSVAAFLGTIVGITLLSFAFQHASTGIVSTLATTYPIWVIPVASIFLKEHPNARQIGCTILAVIGIALLVVPNELQRVWLWLLRELWLQ